MKKELIIIMGLSILVILSLLATIHGQANARQYYVVGGEVVTEESPPSVNMLLVGAIVSIAVVIGYVIARKYVTR